MPVKSFRKTDRSMHKRVARRLVFDLRWTLRVTADLFGVPQPTLRFWLRPWCVTFLPRGGVGQISPMRGF